MKGGISEVGLTTGKVGHALRQCVDAVLGCESNVGVLDGIGRIGKERSESFIELKVRVTKVRSVYLHRNYDMNGPMPNCIPSPRALQLYLI